MKNVKICFVVLHYNTINDTEHFMTSVFENIDVENFQIVIVDNASPNGTGKLLKEKYKNDRRIHVLLNSTNRGFAKGNNAGIAYAEKNFDPDFIVMTNSDTYLIQKDFCQQIQKEYDNSHFFVLGPQIITPKGIVLNQAQVRKPYDSKQIRQMMRSMKYHLIVNYCGIAKYSGAVGKLVSSRRKANTGTVNMDDRRENVYLEGACLIFSRDYIHVYHGINPRTYMYFEEEILFYEMMRDRRKTVYNPSIKIFHNSHGSTNTIYRERQKYMVFKCKNQLRSARILLDIIDRDSRRAAHDRKLMEDHFEKIQ